MAQKILAGLAISGLMMVMCPGIALAGPPIPDNVRQTIKNIENSCRPPEKKDDELKTDFSIVDVVDLNQDGSSDYVFDDSKVNCEFGPKWLNPNGGVGVYIFSDIPDGTARTFHERVFGFRIDRNGAKPVVMISLPPVFCYKGNPPPDPSTATCERPVVWRAVSKKFEIDR